MKALHLLYRFRNQDYEPLDEGFCNYFFKVLESHMCMVYMHAHTCKCKRINAGARTQVCTCTQRPEINAVYLCQPLLSLYIVTESLYVLELTYSPSLANQFAGEMYFSPTKTTGFFIYVGVSTQVLTFCSSILFTEPSL